MTDTTFQTSPLAGALASLAQIQGVRWAAVVSPSGQIVHCTDPGPHARVRAAMLAAAAKLTVEALPRLEVGGFRTMSWEGTQGVAVAGALGENFIVVVADSQVTLGILHVALTRLGALEKDGIPREAKPVAGSAS